MFVGWNQTILAYVPNCTLFHWYITMGLLKALWDHTCQSILSNHPFQILISKFRRSYEYYHSWRFFCFEPYEYLSLLGQIPISPWMSYNTWMLVCWWNAYIYIHTQMYTTTISILYSYYRSLYYPHICIMVHHHHHHHHHIYVYIYT